MSGDGSESGPGPPVGDGRGRDGSSDSMTMSSDPTIRPARQPEDSTGQHRDLPPSDAAIAQQFCRDYLALLSERTERICRHVTQRHVEDALIALRSLETSSQMAGALALVAAAQSLRIAIEEHRDNEIDPLLAAVLTAVAVTRKMQ